jgi:hypothetical protein
MKSKVMPRNYWKLIVRIVRLVILLSTFPLYLVAMMTAYGQNRPGFFFGLFLFMLVYILIAFFSYVAEITPFELMGNVAKRIWQLTSTDKDTD